MKKIITNTQLKEEQKKERVYCAFIVGDTPLFWAERFMILSREYPRHIIDRSVGSVIDRTNSFNKMFIFNLIKK